MTETLPQEIKRRRTAVGMTQAALSAAAGLSSNYVCRLEAGEFNEPSHMKIEDVRAVLVDAERAQSDGAAA